jgi:hypothetical protein
MKVSCTRIPVRKEGHHEGDKATGTEEAWSVGSKVSHRRIKVRR